MKLRVLSIRMVAYIAGNSALMEGGCLNDAAPPGHLKRAKVEMAPVLRLLSGAPLPIFGDDTRIPGLRKVFSAAPLKVNGRDAGYVYVMLFGEERDSVAAHLSADSVLRSTLWSMGLVTLLGLPAGLAAFYLITRPLRQLTEAFPFQTAPLHLIRPLHILTRGFGWRWDCLCWSWRAAGAGTDRAVGRGGGQRAQLRHRGIRRPPARGPGFRRRR